MLDPAHALWAEALFLALGLGFMAYALTAGADFGAGFWSLVSNGPLARAQRQKIAHAIAPIWEANHVWLIFVIVVVFSAFPPAFAALSIAFHIPLAMALVGIVLRGAAFAFSAYGIQTSETEAKWSRVFAWSSALTPIFLGAVVAGVSSGEVRVDANGVTTGFFAGWTTPFALLVGLFVLALFALLAACYLAAESDGALAEAFRRRALGAEAVAGVLAALTLLLAYWYAPGLFDRLARSSFSWPLQAVTFSAAVFTLYSLLTRRLRWARWSSATQVGLVVLGWGLAMDGHFILPDLPLARSATHPEVLRPVALALGAGFLLTVPALYYLYRLFKLG